MEFSLPPTSKVVFRPNLSTQILSKPTNVVLRPFFRAPKKFSNANSSGNSVLSICIKRFTCLFALNIHESFSKKLSPPISKPIMCLRSLKATFFFCVELRFCTDFMSFSC
ncbi:hypothetical protein L596_023867 [Steinernema carpocapsae]|uniref:Uncharacterized protein n=1 Tax=Steinernema carpocapsae TaxID=34508 RepID=A0A4U5MEY3_STECR|nr:hypothetical protein L596_023867 [Steinernema carpocapsae]